ncbi:MAG: hypothetical protein IT454_20755 [Planctomycetes bacterium]|nr:hypothetical protein [Planctomycetota bacterium]
MRLLIGTTLGLAPILAPLPLGDELEFKVKADTRLEKTFDSELALELAEMKMKFGDEELPADHTDGLEMQIVSKDHLVFVDHYRALADGRPTSLVRTFEALESSESQKQSFDGEGDESTTDKESKLEGKSVLFQWNEEQSEFAVSFHEDEGDAELLTELVEDTDLRAFLPGKSVAAGDSWPVEARAFDAILSPGGDLALLSGEEADDSEEVDDQLDQNLSGEIKVTFVETRDEAGTRVAVLHVEAELATHSESTSEEDGESSVETYRIELDVEGDILWDLAHGRPWSYAIEGKSQVVVETKSEVALEDTQLSMSQTLRFEGKYSASGRWTSAE